MHENSAMHENSEGNDPRGNSTTEEDDLKARSTKKPKPNEVGEAEVIMDDPISERKDQCPESLLTINSSAGANQTVVAVGSSEEAAGSSVVAGVPVVVENQPIVQEGNNDPEFLGGVDEKNSQSVDTGLTNEEVGFALQQIEAAAEVANNKNTKGYVKPHGMSQSIKMGLPHRPKVVKENNKSVSNGKGVKSISKPNVVEVSIPSPSVAPSTSDSELMKQKEKEILRLMSRKQNEIWKAYKEGKPIDDYLNLSVLSSTEEDVECVRKLLEKGGGTDFLLSKPPDPSNLIHSSLDSGSVPFEAVFLNDESISHGI
ncbi:hypothetical protein RIF29_17518 [Crotalaria pallida]|uniref:Uncharacterized protein n=1 Tax=Crotalaria pallida TaxID=3830 RepID=A0AAN9FII1_CROPI